MWRSGRDSALTPAMIAGAAKGNGADAGGVLSCQPAPEPERADLERGASIECRGETRIPRRWYRFGDSACGPNEAKAQRGCTAPVPVLRVHLGRRRTQRAVPECKPGAQPVVDVARCRPVTSQGAGAVVHV